MADDIGRPAGFGGALAEQLRWFWQRQRVWIAIVAVLVSAAVAWMITDIPANQPRAAIMMVGVAFQPLLLLIGLSWAFSAWRDDPPKDRQYFWLHPVQRDAHTIARSVAAGLWLLLVVAVFMVVVMVTSQLVHGGEAMIGARFWSFVVASICLAYIVSSIAPVLSDRPGLWLVGSIALIVLANVIANMRDIEWLKAVVRVFNDGKYSLSTALSAPSIAAMQLLMSGEEWSNASGGPDMQSVAAAEPGTALLIWLPIAVVVYVGAVRLSRPR